MSNPACGDCGRPADLVVKDHSRGYQASRTDANSPGRRICSACLKALQDAEADDPWPVWADPQIIHRYTDQETEMPTTESTETLADRLAPLAAELAAVQERIERLAGEEALLKSKIRELVDGPDKYEAGGLVVVVSTNTRFNEKRALELLPEPVKELVTYPQTRVDREKLRVLAPEVWDASQDTYDLKIGLR